MVSLSIEQASKRDEMSGDAVFLNHFLGIYFHYIHEHNSYIRRGSIPGAFTSMLHRPDTFVDLFMGHAGKWAYSRHALSAPAHLFDRLGRRYEILGHSARRRS